MKNIKINNKGHYECEECKLECKTLTGLSRHIKFHSSKQNYYDKWLKNDKDGLCKICGEKTEFTGFKYFYKNCCSTKCAKIYNVIKSEEGCMKKYNVKNPNNIKEIVIKRNKTRRKNKKLDSDYFSKKIKETLILNKIKDPLYQEKINEKIQSTWLLNYNVDHPMKSNKVKLKTIETKKKRKKFNPHYQKNINEKRKNTCLLNLGVPYPMQNKKSLEKQQKSSLKLHKYKNTNLYYQGSYELDFLEKYYDKFSDIKRGPSIKYKLNNECKVYFPDFYIPSLNLIVEVKGSYWKNYICDIKKRYCIYNGYKYIIIIDKDYNFFKTMI